MATSSTIPRTVDDWLEQIRLAKSYQAEDGRLERWKQNHEYYDNIYPEHVIAVNLVFSIGRALVPQLYFKTPTLLCMPRKPGRAQQAKILEAIDSWLIPHLGMKQQIKLAILDAYRTNIGVFKFGYHSIGTELPSTREEPSPTRLGPMRTALADYLSRVSPALGTLMRPNEEEEDDQEEARRRYSYHDWIRPNAPWMLRVDPKDFLVPWRARDIHEAPWCAFRVVRPLEDVKEDPVYAQTATLQANVKMTLPLSGAVRSPNDQGVILPSDKGPQQAVPMVELFEVWDKRTGKLTTVAEGHDKFLRDEEHGWEIDGLPVEILNFNPNGDDFWGKSDVDQIKVLVQVYNETRTVELMHKKTAVTKFLFSQDAIDDTELDKATQGRIAFIKMKLPPVGNVMPLTMNMSRDLYNMSDVSRKDISEVIGYSRNQVGEYDADRRTATEAAMVQQALQLRADERRDQVADVLAAAFQRKIHPTIFQFWDTPRIIEVTALGGWVEYTGADIKGDYEVKTVADSVVPLTRMERQRTSLIAFEKLKNDPRIDQQRLYSVVLGAFEDVLPPDLLLPPQQQQQNMLQQALQAGGMPGQPGQPASPAEGNGRAEARPLVSSLQ